MNKPPRFYVMIATGFGAGFSRLAPGTAGALVATLGWLALSYFVSATFLLIITILLIGVFTILGIMAGDKLEPFWGEDSQRIVVDEMVGVWIALLAVPGNDLIYAAAAFVLFRLFDIFKPLGIRRMESFKGGVGVMMDDILAGVYSCVLLIGVRWIIG